MPPRHARGSRQCSPCPIWRPRNASRRCACARALPSRCATLRRRWPTSNSSRGWRRRTRKRGPISASCMRCGGRSGERDRRTAPIAGAGRRQRAQLEQPRQRAVGVGGARGGCGSVHGGDRHRAELHPRVRESRLGAARSRPQRRGRARAGARARARPVNVAALGKLASLRHRGDRLADAIALYARAVRAAPQDAELCALLARADRCRRPGRRASRLRRGRASQPGTAARADRRARLAAAQHLLDAGDVERARGEYAEGLAALESELPAAARRSMPPTASMRCAGATSCSRTRGRTIGRCRSAMRVSWVRCSRPKRHRACLRPRRGARRSHANRLRLDVLPRRHRRPLFRQLDHRHRPRALRSDDLRPAPRRGRAGHRTARLRRQLPRAAGELAECGRAHHRGRRARRPRLSRARHGCDDVRARRAAAGAAAVRGLGASGDDRARRDRCLLLQRGDGARRRCVPLHGNAGSAARHRHALPDAGGARRASRAPLRIAGRPGRCSCVRSRYSRSTRTTTSSSARCWRAIRGRCWSLFQDPNPFTAMRYRTRLARALDARRHRHRRPGDLAAGDAARRATSRSTRCATPCSTRCAGRAATRRSTRSPPACRSSRCRGGSCARGRAPRCCG